MKKTQQPIAGILPAICTTFAPDGSLDLAAQREIVRFVLDCGADGIVCFGLAGEVNKLTPDERKRLTSLIIEEVDGRVPVLVGVGSEALHTSKELARFVEGEGAAGVVIPPPITSHLDEDGLAPYFAGIADEVSLPVMIQDAPNYLGIKLSAAGIRRLAEKHQNIRYVKLETGPQATAEWIKELSPRIGVLTGNAGMFLPSDMRAGCVGNVPGTELTDLLVEIYRTEKQGNAAKADDLFNPLLPYLAFSGQGIDHYNCCCKEVLVRRGILKNGGLRTPGPVLSAVSQKLLDGFVADLSLVAAPPASKAAGARQARH